MKAKSRFAVRWVATHGCPSGTGWVADTTDSSGDGWNRGVLQSSETPLSVEELVNVSPGLWECYAGDTCPKPGDRAEFVRWIGEGGEAVAASLADDYGDPWWVEGSCSGGGGESGAVSPTARSTTLILIALCMMPSRPSRLRGGRPRGI